ncbi:response regulator transcription factor [Pedobacter panaciterrae]|uniref:Response regulator transcription factor n=1 Tax=Pedobacter panaciterrae TaxID=363849 RepID=A0ABU8NTK0_9SPHI|nr:response regulator transcription factor [uncultured Pedobacter sp.]
MIRILLYEDNTQLREVLFILLNGTPGYELLGAYGDCTNILEEVKQTNPDLILMDIDMPFMNGIEGLKLLRAKGFQCKVLMLTVFDDNQNVFEAIRSGANGYILKKTPPARLIEFIEDALNGGAPMTSSIATQVLNMFAENHKSKTETFNLSAREQEVLNLLVDGYSYKLIADKLFISMDTVRSHIKKIYDKLQVNSKSEAVAKTLRANL